MSSLISIAIKFVAVIMLLTAIIFPKANAFPVRAEVYYDQITSVAVVTNYYARGITCFGRAQGLTTSGQFVYSYMNGITLFPGQDYQLYVFANNWHPFISAQAFVDCTFI